MYNQYCNHSLFNAFWFSYFQIVEAPDGDDDPEGAWGVYYMRKNNYFTMGEKQFFFVNSDLENKIPNPSATLRGRRVFYDFSKK